MESSQNNVAVDESGAGSQNKQERAVILVVDDEEEIRRVMRLTLTIAGYEVREAEDGNKALESLQKNPPDLILLDVLMPGMDGFEVCRHVRADSETAHIPILILSARTDSQSREEGFRAGATKYLTKPISPPQLLHQIDEALNDAINSSV
jgi:CheY-like chemotaxis protein